MKVSDDIVRKMARGEYTDGIDKKIAQELLECREWIRSAYLNLMGGDPEFIDRGRTLVEPKATDEQVSAVISEPGANEMSRMLAREVQAVRAFVKNRKHIYWISLPELKNAIGWPEE